MGLRSWFKGKKKEDKEDGLMFRNEEDILPKETEPKRLSQDEIRKGREDYVSKKRKKWNKRGYDVSTSDTNNGGYVLNFAPIKPKIVQNINTDHIPCIANIPNFNISGEEMNLLYYIIHEKMREIGELKKIYEKQDRDSEEILKDRFDEDLETFKQVLKMQQATYNELKKQEQKETISLKKRHDLLFLDLNKNIKIKKSNAQLYFILYKKKKIGDIILNN